jgi:hypothetical protein
MSRVVSETVANDKRWASSGVSTMSAAALHQATGANYFLHKLVARPMNLAGLLTPRNKYSLFLMAGFVLDELGDDGVD